MTTHTYDVTVTWTGNTAFRGDPQRWNPEQLLVASVAQCHMLWYLHLCAVNKVVVTSYVDNPTGTMAETSDGGFTLITLRPQVTVTEPGMAHRAAELHEQAHHPSVLGRPPVQHAGAA
jgi:organic hydroperoxide reductase OsmC/OhrA